MSKQEGQDPLEQIQHIESPDAPGAWASEMPSARASEVIELAERLVRIPSVTNCPEERLDEVVRCADEIAGELRKGGLEVREWRHGKYPALVAGFPGGLLAPVTLVGHFDVVRPEPDDRQLVPRLEGDYLWGRGAADMKTVVASYVVWMSRRRGLQTPYPPINLLLVGNEENGEVEPFGTPHVLEQLEQEQGWRPQLMIVGERSDETGMRRFTPVCTATRGVLRLKLEAHGVCGHTGTSAVPDDLLGRLIEAHRRLDELAAEHLTLQAPDGWATTIRFPFLIAGEDSVYNITAGHGSLGIEVRPIPEDDCDAFLDALEALARRLDLVLIRDLADAGNLCPADNPYLAQLLAAIEEASGEPAEIDRKMSGSSARFAPGGNAVVWGQSGIGPHSREERHHIPSIEPYLQVLDRLAERLLTPPSEGASQR